MTTAIIKVTLVHDAGHRVTDYYGPFSLEDAEAFLPRRALKRAGWSIDRTERLMQCHRGEISERYEIIPLTPGDRL